MPPGMTQDQVLGMTTNLLIHCAEEIDEDANPYREAFGSMDSLAQVFKGFYPHATAAKTPPFLSIGGG